MEHSSGEEDVLLNRFLSKQRPSLSDASQGSFGKSYESILSGADPGLGRPPPQNNYFGVQLPTNPASSIPQRQSQPQVPSSPTRTFDRTTFSESSPGGHSHYQTHVDIDYNNMGQVIGAVMKQSETIRKLQQAVNDLETTRQQAPPNSPPKWSELKRTLASKSNFAEVDDLRSKIRSLEEQVQTMSRKETKRPFTPTDVKEALKMLESEDDLSPGKTVNMDLKFQEFSTKIEKSMKDQIQNMLKKSVDHLRTDLKSDFTNLVGTTLLSSHTKELPPKAAYDLLQGSRSDYIEFGRIRELLADLQTRCSSIESQMSGRNQYRTNGTDASPIRQKIYSLEATVSKALKEFETLKSDSDTLKKTQLDMFTLKNELERLKARTLKDVKQAIGKTEEFSLALQECRNVISSQSQKESQLSVELSKAVKEVNSLKVQLAERKTAEEELRSRLEALEKVQKGVVETITDISEAENRVQKRIDFHAVAVENLRKEHKNMKEEQWQKQSQAPIALANLKSDVMEEVARVERNIDQKVDTAVIEELMRHLATRDEVSNLFKSITRDMNVEGRIKDSLRQDITVHIMQEARHKMGIIADSLSSTLYEKLSQELKVDLFKLKRSMAESFDNVPKNDDGSMERFVAEVNSLRSKLDRHMKACRDEVSKISHSVASIRNDRSVSPSIEKKEAPQQLSIDHIPAEAVKEISQLISRDFDEKFFLLCSDLSACKSAYQMAASQPFFKCGQWIWRSNQLKNGSAIPWNFETANTDPDNFKWEQEQPFIRVAEAGLYEITFAFFTKSRPSIQVVVNGESVMSAINSPTYVVHHGSGFVHGGEGKLEQGCVTGISLMDFLALPAKSTVALHYHANKKMPMCHGFLGLKRL
ncbi:hypothetical protein HDU97_003109 [Phlyctochytrium planicorne]|nr:hypothetical protein HDU97_003061 [Phlyctochytrium planicorne]KAJ3109681.1 hypothetical protein HDU97_003109 [Phlyctochytrium planicorne]